MKIKLRDEDYIQIDSFAHNNFLEMAIHPKMDGKAFVTLCWTKAVLDYLSSKDLADIEIDREDHKWLA